MIMVFKQGRYTVGHLSYDSISCMKTKFGHLQTMSIVCQCHNYIEQAHAEGVKVCSSGLEH